MRKQKTQGTAGRLPGWRGGEEWDGGVLGGKVQDAEGDDEGQGALQLNHSTSACASQWHPAFPPALHPLTHPW